MEAYYANDLVLLLNTPAQAEYLLHSLEQAAKGTGFYMNSDKTEFMCFKYGSFPFILNNKPLKLVKLIYKYIYIYSKNGKNYNFFLRHS